MPCISSKTAVLGTSPRVSVTCGRQQYSSGSNGRRIVPPVKAFAYSYTENCGPHSAVTYERVLRYPDGRERRIRYPVPSEDGSNVNATLDSCGVVDEWETHNAYKAARGGLTTTTSQVMSPVDPQDPVISPSEQPSEPPHPAPMTSPPQAEPFPDSPLALLRYLNSDAHKESQRKEWEEVKNSYEILQGCPWPVTRPVYVLAARQNQHQNESDAGLTHTLRTRLPLSDVEDELTTLLRGLPTNKDGTSRKNKPLISCSELVDGIITFELEDDAEQYGQLLEESGTAESVAVARCDSHELFRNVQSVQGVVVLLRRGCKVPRPHQLASALRGGKNSQQPLLASIDSDDETKEER